MNLPGQDLIDFWKISSAGPGPDPENSRTLNGVNVFFHRGEPGPERFLSLELDESLAPPWLGKNEKVTVFLNRQFPATGGNGKTLAYLNDGREKHRAIVEQDGNLIFNFDPDEIIRNIQSEKYLKPKRPLHTRVPFPYQFVPGNLRLFGFKMLTKIRRSQSEVYPFPQWPVDKSVETLRWAFRNCLERPGAPPADRYPHWPAGKKYALALSHDVDTGKGFENIQEIATLEEKSGFTSCWFIVGKQYPIDFSLLDSLTAKKHEIGLHGDNHDNRISYLSPDQIQRRLGRCSGLIERYLISGFRPPSLLDSIPLRKALGRDFLYCSSIPDTEIDSLIAPRRGCATVFPFFKQGILELPLTLPLEDKLILSGLKEEQILDLWKNKISWIRSVGGMALLSTHAEPHLFHRIKRIYERLLKELAEDCQAFFATPGDIARWWQRDKNK